MPIANATGRGASCAVTDKEKQALINKLSGGSKIGFNAKYSTPNRKWFAGKIIDSLIAQNVPDSDIEQKANEIIAAAGSAVKARAKGGPAPGSLVDKWDKFDQLTSRTEIIYGMIAMNPQFLDPANSDYFDFILERRYRAIWRMHFYVNPNKYRGEFDYPGSGKMQVNKDSNLLWKPFLDNSIPFILTPSGQNDPAGADETLFQRNKDTDRNLLSCDAVAAILHMDALRAAKDPGKLLKALVETTGQYLKIDHPGGHCANSPDGQRLAAVSSAHVNHGEHTDIEVGNAGPILELIKDQLTPQMLGDDNYISLNLPKMKFMIVQGDLKDFFKVESVDPATRMVRADKLANDYEVGARIYKFVLQFPFYDSLPFHFITDDRPGQALFEQRTLKATDLQVGDHIYVINHPLYRLYYPTGPWGGEHSFVTEIGTRDTSGNAFRNELRVEGHGVSRAGTLLKMSEEMIGYVNKILGVLQALTRIHLANLKANGRATANVVTPNGTFAVKFIARKEPDPGGNMIDTNVFEYTGIYTFSYLSQGKMISDKYPAFVIKELASNPGAGFRVFSYLDTNSAVDPTHAPKAIINVTFNGSGPADQFTLSKWVVTWFNTQTTRFEWLPLFETDNKTPVWLSFDDLLITKPFFVTGQTGDVYVTRPRVDFSAAYQTFLKSNGAF